MVQHYISITELRAKNYCFTKITKLNYKKN